MYHYTSKKNRNLALSLALGGLFFSAATFAAPVSEIVFTNETLIALDTSIAGFPGNGVDANTSKAVSYGKVAVGCWAGGDSYNCGINFANRETGEQVATVYINAETATLTQAPIFHGDYGSQYEVTGWESSPITHITIKAIS
tara:strand:+ start:11563 stop:11988 length:426 start_codon:yes stop_codon:yes gene_type:complete